MHILGELSLTLYGVLSKCIVGPSVLSAPLPASKSGKLFRQWRIRRLIRSHYANIRLWNTTRQNTWICQKAPIRRRMEVVWTRCYNQAAYFDRLVSSSVRHELFFSTTLRWQCFQLSAELSTYNNSSAPHSLNVVQSHTRHKGVLQLDLLFSDAGTTQRNVAKLRRTTGSCTSRTSP